MYLYRIKRFLNNFFAKKFPHVSFCYLEKKFFNFDKKIFFTCPQSLGAYMYSGVAKGAAPPAGELQPPSGALPRKK